MLAAQRKGSARVSPECLDQADTLSDREIADIEYWGTMLSMWPGGQEASKRPEREARFDG